MHSTNDSICTMYCETYHIFTFDKRPLINANMRVTSLLNRMYIREMSNVVFDMKQVILLKTTIIQHLLCKRKKNLYKQSGSTRKFRLLINIILFFIV